ncbi:MAG: hypothetical protein RLZZ229_879 [Actinomycetota bacterium]|jgi:ComF family protein
MSAFGDLIDFLLPTKCVWCSALGAPLCQGCQANFISQPRLVTRGSLQGLAVTDYQRAAKLVHGYKEGGQLWLASFMAKQMAGQLTVNFDLLVPVPSTKANYKIRGFSPAKVLASRLLWRTKVRFSIADVLSFNRDVSDQAALGVSGRFQNLANSMSCKRSLAGKRVLLIDDVVTTGATLQEAARAVRANQGKVVGFITFAETPKQNC